MCSSYAGSINRRIMVQASLGTNVRPYSKITWSYKDWDCGLNYKASASQGQDSELKSQAMNKKREKKNCGEWYPHIIPEFRGNIFRFSPFTTLLIIVLLNITFHYVEVSSIYSYFGAFILKVGLIMSKAFFASIEMIMWFCSYSVSGLCDGFWLVYVEQSLYCGMKPTWSWHMIF
jgi:hypothetical protein